MSAPRSIGSPLPRPRVRTSEGMEPFDRFALRATTTITWTQGQLSAYAVSSEGWAAAVWMRMIDSQQLQAIGL